MVDLPNSRNGMKALDVAIRAAKEAGRIIVERYRSDIKVQHKGRGNIVTDVDLLVERETIAFLREEYPTHGILSEESVKEESSSGYTWIVDPLDGTRNYASGVPMFSVNLALVLGGEVILGITYDPLRNELFWAQKGRGAFLNDAPISVSSNETVKASLIGSDMGYDDEKARRALELVLALWPGMQSMRIMGSAALGLAYAACGRLDLYFHHSLAPWDIVSGILLVKEAGGVITDRDGGPVGIHSSGVIASNKAIHADFLKLTEGLAWRS